jgi:hypothetical protein
MAAPQPRPTADDRIRAALWFAGRGWGIFPVWSARADGTCRCPAARSCSSPGKHPVSAHGFQDATTDPGRIRAFLSAASDPNYGMVPPDGVFVWDVDSDEERSRLASLEARCGPRPPTLTLDTAHGQHVAHRWPEGFPRPLKRMFGLITRWGSGSAQGYIVGPRSVHATGAVYAPAEGTVLDVADLPESWARAAVEGERAAPGTIVVDGPVRPEDVPIGHRHEFLRDRARHYAGTVRDPDALFAAVWALNERLPAPKTADEVRRAIGEALTRFPADPVEEDPETGEVRVVQHDEPPMMAPSDDESLFPPLPGPLAFGGLLGEVTDFLLGGTDAAAEGILGSLVAFCGALVPAWGYWHGRHPSSPFVALVGKSSIGRKGTAMYRVRDALGNSLGMDAVNRARFDGIASGEALVRALLDRARETFGVPTGVLFEEEYATFLAASGREGSNLDSRMRSAFDGKQLAHRRVGETIFVPEPYYLSGLVAITPEELQARADRGLTKTGSGNRWLWLPVRRRSVRVVSSEPVLPMEMTEALAEAHRAAIKSPPRIDPGPGVDDLLSEYDEYLRSESVGLAADMTRRYGVIAFRMGLVHAAVERSRVVAREHVMRAVALTEYARAGLSYAFGSALGDASATHLLRMLLEADGHSLPQSVISKYFVRDPIRRQVAIDDLCRLGLAEVVPVRTRGRKRSELRLVTRKADFRDFRALFGTGADRENDSASVEKRAEVRVSAHHDCAEGAQKVRGRCAEVSGWLRHCRHYEDHRDHHRNTIGGWICLACDEEEET